MPEPLLNSQVDMTPLSVLLAEDNVHMRRMLRAILAGLGIGQIHESEDGADALEKFASQPADLVITDWEMPIIDGLELTRFIRNPNSSPDPYVPIIMLSGHASRACVVRARDSGITEFVCKPVAATTLYKRILNCLLNPRPFVRTSSFFGPDRRRFVNPAYDGDERRLVANHEGLDMARSA